MFAIQNECPHLAMGQLAYGDAADLADLEVVALTSTNLHQPLQPKLMLNSLSRTGKPVHAQLQWRAQCIALCSTWQQGVVLREASANPSPPRSTRSRSRRRGTSCSVRSLQKSLRWKSPRCKSRMGIGCRCTWSRPRLRPSSADTHRRPAAWDNDDTRFSGLYSRIHG